MRHREEQHGYCYNCDVTCGTTIELIVHDYVVHHRCETCSVCFESALGLSKVCS